MSTEFNIEIVALQKINQIDNAWSEKDFKALLAIFDIDEASLNGMSEAELKEMCLMSLSDCQGHESAKHLLTYVFEDDITEGQIDQMSHQMADSNLWEEHAEPAYHHQLFNVYELLRKAYNGTFSEPTGVKFRIKITADDEEAFSIFETSLHAVIVRLLSAGLNEAAILNRLFADRISGDSFPSAEKILWILKEVAKDKAHREYEITSSELWFGELAQATSFKAEAHADLIKNAGAEQPST